MPYGASRAAGNRRLPVARSRDMDDPDVGLMLRVRDGDEEAFRQLFRRHSPRVLQFVRRHVGDPAVADELAQDVFLQLFQARRRYRPTARFTTWLYTIALNVCRNELRRPERRRRIRPETADDEEAVQDFDLMPADDPTSEEAVAGRELEGRLRNALQKLPEKQRTAFLLSRVDGLAYRDVAGVLRCTEGAVKALLFRATQSLRRDLQDVLSESPEVT